MRWSQTKYDAVGYPFNLIDEIYQEEHVWVDDQDHMLGLKHALETLTEREQEMIVKRFQEMKTLEEAGREFGVTRERARQMEAKAIRKLRHPSRRNFIMYGYFGGAELKKLKAKEEELNEREQQLEKREKTLQEVIDRYKPKFDALHINIDMPLDVIRENVELSAGIETLDLSVRSYNCLRRAGIRTIYDLIDLASSDNYMDLTTFRHLGRKSLEEIVTHLYAMTGKDFRGKYCV